MFCTQRLANVHIEPEGPVTFSQYSQPCGRNSSNSPIPHNHQKNGKNGRQVFVHTLYSSMWTLADLCVQNILCLPCPVCTQTLLMFTLNRRSMSYPTSVLSPPADCIEEWCNFTSQLLSLFMLLAINIHISIPEVSGFLRQGLMLYHWCVIVSQNGVWGLIQPFLSLACCFSTSEVQWLLRCFFFLSFSGPSCTGA